MRTLLPTLITNLFLKRPTTTVLFVTNRCNLDCRMCFYTQRERRDELTPKEFKKIAQSLPPQTYVMFTGGEPFLREDLPEIVGHFYQRGAGNLHIATNGTMQDRTVSGARQIALGAPKSRVILVASLDGPAEVHDFIRHSQGAHSRTVETMRALLDLKKECRNLAVLANFTFTSYNQDHWKETIDFLWQDLGVDAVNLGLVRGRTKEIDAKAIDLDKYSQAHRYLVRSNRRNYFSSINRSLARFKEVEQFETISQIARGTPPDHYSCLAGRVFNVITETGDVYPCEMLDRKIGNLRDVEFDFMRLWRSDTAVEIGEYIDKRECLCTYECAMGPSMAASFSTLPRLIDFSLNWRERVQDNERKP